MQKNRLFLIIGLILSVVSKILQFVFSSKVGDFIVIFAAIFFVLAILYTIPRYVKLVEENNHVAKKQAVYSCLSVVSFQFLMILVVGNKQYFGFVFLIPFILFTWQVIRFWFLHQDKTIKG